ncbi:MAG: hypothetical protein C5B50_03475 [Verrucomicrobia bacterium]|nr:MAG: hypothetical protein C5B50_03475 [Verrucomicrobiota bacterium]
MRAPGLQEQRVQLVGRVPSRGAPLPFAEKCEPIGTSSLILVLAAVLFSALFPPPTIRAQQRSDEADPAHFFAIDIYIDSKGTALAAYQFEFAATNSLVKIVGIEGGEHPAFRVPPFYDPKAIQHEKVIIAAFSTLPRANLPSGKTRVATIHLLKNGTRPPGFSLRLQAAGDPDGNRFFPQPSFEQRKPE